MCVCVWRRWERASVRSDGWGIRQPLEGRARTHRHTHSLWDEEEAQSCHVQKRTDWLFF